MIKTKKQFPFLPLIIGAFLLGLAFIPSLKSPNNIFVNASTTVDSGVFIYMGRAILNGDMPYRDFFDHKGPLLYLINALGIWLSPTRGVWLMDYIAFAITFVMVYQIARLKCGPVFSLAVVVVSTYELFTYYIEANGTETYAMPFIAVAVYIFLDYFLNKKINSLRLVLCGLSFGAVFLLRPNMISVWLVMCFGVLLQCIIDKKLNQIGFFLSWFLLGFFLICGPIIFWLCINGAFGEFINNYFIFNLTYASHSELASNYAKVKAFFHFFSFESTLLCFCLASFLCAIKKDLLHFLYLAIILVSLFFMALSGWTSEHYAMVMIPVVAYPFSCAASYIECDVNQKRYSIIPVTLMLLISFVVPVWLNGIQDLLDDVSCRGMNFVHYHDQVVCDLILDHTQKDDKIIVCGNYNLYYNLTDRFASSRFSYQWPIAYIDKSIEHEFFQDLYANNPKIVVLFHDFYAYDAILNYLNDYSYRIISGDDIDHVSVFLLES